MTLTYGGKSYGYQLYEDQYGQKHWNEGLADLIAPQSRISEFSYEHIPPQIDVPAAFEDWSMGAGYTEFRARFGTALTASNTNMPVSYNYSQNIDASWDNRLYLSPLLNTNEASTGGSIAANPTFYFNSDYFGFWCAADEYLYRYDLNSNSWVLKYTGAANIKSMAELNGVLYVALDNSAYAYTTSTTGSTFTVYSDDQIDSASIADFFVVRGDVLMAMRSENAYLTTNGQNGGVVWSAPTTIGSSSETTKSMVVANNQYWIFKKQGIYMWDGTTVSPIWSPEYLTDNNGAYSFVWYDGNIYTTYAYRILAIDPFNTQYSSLKFVYPPEGGRSTGLDSVGPHDSTEIKGNISQITGTFSDLMFTITNPDGNTYIIKGDPLKMVYHTLGYIGENASVAAYAVGPGVTHPENPCFVFGKGQDSVHYILTRDDLRPEDDANYRFVNTGVIYGPWLGYGARAFNKFLNRGTVLGTNISARQNIVLSYQLNDNSQNTTDLVTAINYDLNTANVLTTVSFNRIRYIITMNSGSPTSTPVMTSATFHATLNPPRRRTWKPLINLRPNQLLRDGVADYQDVRELRNALFSGVSERITMTDRDNNSYIVRILDIQEMQLSYSTTGAYETDNQVFQVTLAEIVPLTSQLQVAKYTQARYKEGYRYN
jgi:hypothetical protein